MNDYDKAAPDARDAAIMGAYPDLFGPPPWTADRTCMAWGFCVGEGWRPIVLDLLEELRGIVAAEGLGRFRVIQVKEKFGGLRVYARQQFISDPKYCDRDDDDVVYEPVSPVRFDGDDDPDDPDDDPSGPGGAAPTSSDAPEDVKTPDETAAQGTCDVSAPADGAHEAPVAAFEEALAALAAAGARIAHAAPPCVAQAMDLAGILFAPEAYGQWRAQIEAAPELMYPPILERFRGGREVSAADYVAGWHRLDRLRAEWAAAVAGFDAVLLPTAPILPPEAARLESDGAFFAAENLLALRNTRIGNLMGLPAITLPTRRPACGLMALGVAGQDSRLLRTAAAMERALAS